MTVDKAAARELELYFENDGQIHNSRVIPIQEDLRKKIAKHTFEAVKSIDLWVHAIDDAAKKYAKEFGGTWHKLFSPQTRRFVAVRAALQFMQEEGLPVSKDDWKKVSLDDDPSGLGSVDPEDDPFVSMTYGVVPSRAVFDAKWDLHVGDRKYPMTISDKDLTRIDSVGGEYSGIIRDPKKPDRHGSMNSIGFTKNNMFDLIKRLADSDDDDATGLASSILNTLHIEWV